jgi:hypothetical protein
MLDDSHNFITKQWQYYLIAINPSMVIEDVYFLLDNNLAFCNESGLRSSSDPRQDWFHNRNIDDGSKPPQFDKVRICSFNSITGIEQYSLAQAMRDTISTLRSNERSLMKVRSALVMTNVLNVKTFDGRYPPPLKSGRHYPRTLNDITPDDYLYLPRYNREMFMVADMVNRSGDVSQFPRGGLYSWTSDSTPYTFLPYMSNPTFGAVRVPLGRFTKLAKDSPVPPVYRKVT